MGLSGGLKEEERQKNTKSRSEEKILGFSSTSLFRASKWEAVTRVETSG